MFVWVKGPAGLDMDAVNRKTAFVPGTFFFARPGDDRRRSRSGTDAKTNLSAGRMIKSLQPGMVGCGSDQGRSILETAGVAVLRRGVPKSENADLGLKVPFL